jgi:hypothetical protein
LRNNYDSVKFWTKEELMIFRQMAAFVDGAGQKQYEKNAGSNEAGKRLVEFSLG